MTPPQSGSDAEGLLYPFNLGDLVTSSKQSCATRKKTLGDLKYVFYRFMWSIV